MVTLHDVRPGNRTGLFL